MVTCVCECGKQYANIVDLQMHHLDYCAVVEEKCRDHSNPSNVCQVIGMIDRVIDGRSASNGRYLGTKYTISN